MKTILTIFGLLTAFLVYGQNDQLRLRSYLLYVATNTAYAANDVLIQPVTVSNAFRRGFSAVSTTATNTPYTDTLGLGTLRSLTVLVKSNVTPAMTFYFFSRPPSTLATNTATWAPTFDDMAFCTGWVIVTNEHWRVQATNNVAQRTDLHIPLASTYTNAHFYFAATADSAHEYRNGDGALNQRPLVTLTWTENR